MYAWLFDSPSHDLVLAEHFCNFATCSCQDIDLVAFTHHDLKLEFAGVLVLVFTFRNHSVPWLPGWLLQTKSKATGLQMTGARRVKDVGDEMHKV